jgi:prepilin-type processing-associated H-X9-DG protein
MPHSCYLGIAGPFVYWNLDLTPTTWQLQQTMLGVFYPLSRTSIASITDGSSNTIMFSETAPSKGYPDSDTSGASRIDFTAWWMAGDPYDTQGSASWPPNPKAKVIGSSWGSPALVSSRHPGGVNCGFADGSVRFIKDSIDSWQIDPQGNCASISYAPDTYPTLVPGQKVGVWQALSTRASGEVISADAY